MIEGKLWVHLNTCATLQNLIWSTEATVSCIEKTNGKQGITVNPGTTSINLGDTAATSFDNAGITAGWFVSITPAGHNAGTYVVESVEATRLKLTGAPSLSATNSTTLTLVASRRKIRMYPVKAPQKPTRPYCTYQRVSGVEEYTMQGPAVIERVRIQIDCWSTSYLEAKQIGAGVKTSIERATAFTIHGYTDQDLYEPDVDCYRVVQDFILWNKE